LIADCSLQQTNANEDEMKKVEQRIQSLGGILTYPIGDKDREEKMRREALMRFVLPLRDSDTPFNRAVYPQEVGWDYCETRTTFRTNWDFEVPQER
jgi:hypothetical protein